MSESESALIGVSWLAREYNVSTISRPRFISRIAKIESERWIDGYCQATFRPRYLPEPTFAGHFEFYLTRERISLEFCARLFEVIGPQPVEEWVRTHPTGQYARRTGFLYEFLTGDHLDTPPTTRGSYVTALDPVKYVCAEVSENNKRWRVRNNLLGTAEFCPTIIRTDSVAEAEAIPIGEIVKQLDSEFGEELLRRSAVWLTIKESRASFAIEHESELDDRIRRFAVTMERETGRYEEPLSSENIEHLQREILGPKAVRYGLRRSPVFVGETSMGIEVVHYIAPHWDDIVGMLEGLRETDRRTMGLSSIVRAAILSFGFVYIHPLADGNGRVSRFLINDVLRRDGVVPSPNIVPISAHIIKNMSEYDRILESVSRPLMQHYQDEYLFGEAKTYEDGAVSNFNFTKYQDAAKAWRYLDLTDHVGYLGNVLVETIENEMREEAMALRTLRQARAALNAVIEASDQDLDRIVRSIRENGGRVSGKLETEFPLLEDPKTANAAIKAVLAAFEPSP